jgi:hypothetical protein
MTAQEDRIEQIHGLLTTCARCLTFFTWVVCIGLAAGVAVGIIAVANASH